MKTLKVFSLIITLFFHQIGFTAGEVVQMSPQEKLGKGAHQMFYQKMKASLDFHITNFNEQRVNKEYILKLFPKKDRSKLKDILKNISLKDLPTFKENHGEYFYQVTEDVWITFSLEDLKNYQINLNNQPIDLRSISAETALDQILKEAEQKSKPQAKSVQVILDLLGIPEANAGGLFAVAVIATVGIGAAWYWISSQFDPDFEEAEAMGQSFERLDEIAKLCEANKQGLLNNLQAGVTKENSLIHHLLWRTQDWGYDSEELIEEISADYADDCNEYGEKIVAGLVSKYDTTLDGTDFAKKRINVLKKMGCDQVRITVGMGNAREAYLQAKQKLIECAQKSCRNLVSRHDSCLKDFNEEIDKSTRKSNAEKAQPMVDWSKSIDSSTLSID